MLPAYASNLVRSKILTSGKELLQHKFVLTTAVAQWLQRPPGEREVVGSIPGRDRRKSLKLVVVAFPLDPQDYGIAQ